MEGWEGNKPPRASSGLHDGPELQRDTKRRRGSLASGSFAGHAALLPGLGPSAPASTSAPYPWGRAPSGAAAHSSQPAQPSAQQGSDAPSPATSDASVAGAAAAPGGVSASGEGLGGPHRPRDGGLHEAGSIKREGGQANSSLQQQVEDGPVVCALGEGAGGVGAAATPQPPTPQQQGQQGAGAGKGKGGMGKGKGRAMQAAAEATVAAASAAGVGTVRVEGPPGKGLGKDMSAAAAAAAAGGSGYIKPDVVTLPLEIGSRVQCKWRNQEYYRSKVIERRVKPGIEVPEGAAPKPEDFEYYMHYFGFNRRMDEWVQLDQMDLSTVEVELPDPDPKRKKKAIAEESDSDHGDFDPNALREHEEFTKVKNIDQIELGRHLMDTWYFSPFPPEYRDCKKLYFCEYTLQFFKHRSQLMRHLSKVRTRHPPGDEIYRNGNVCMFEVDGKKEKNFSQNLCFLAKLFLDHKTLYYDVDLFLFYVLCEIDERGAHVVGYFSKEKASEEGYNLACILTLPAYQRKGYGKFLISMSYELSKIEGKVGTPERPLSDLGRVSYHGYWTRELLMLLASHEGTISIKDLSARTAIKPDDVHNTLQQLGMMQYQKGQHVICAAPGVIEKQLKAAGGPGLVVDPSKIVWTPYNAEREYANQRQ